MRKIKIAAAQLGQLVNDVRTWWHDNNNSKEREMLRQVLLSEKLNLSQCYHSSPIAS